MSRGATAKLRAAVLCECSLIVILVLLTADDRIPRLLPGAEAALDGLNVGVPVVHQPARRTGARFLVGSGAVGDDLRVPGQFPVARLQIGQGERDGVGNVGRVVFPLRAHVHEQRCPGVVPGLGLGQGNARHLRVGDALLVVGIGQRAGGRARAAWVKGIFSGSTPSRRPYRRRNSVTMA